MPEDQMICQIAGVKVKAEDEDATDGEDGAEPEVIGKDKEEGGDSKEG